MKPKMDSETIDLIEILFGCTVNSIDPKLFGKTRRRCYLWLKENEPGVSFSDKFQKHMDNYREQK